MYITEEGRDRVTHRGFPDRVAAGNKNCKPLDDTAFRNLYFSNKK